MAFGKDGVLFISTGVGVELWNQAESTNLLAGTEFAQVAHIFLSPDGSTLAVVGSVLTDDGPRRLYLFDVAGRKLLSNSVLPRFPLDLYFAPNDQQLSVEFAQGDSFSEFAGLTIRKSNSVSLVKDYQATD
jgi:hypothetical protein